MRGGGAGEGVLGLIGRADLPRLLAAMPLREADIEAPIVPPRRNIFCVGKNYHDHAKEFASSGFDSSAANGVVPKHPIIFSKVPECLVPHAAPIHIHATLPQPSHDHPEL